MMIQYCQKRYPTRRMEFKISILISVNRVSKIKELFNAYTHINLSVYASYTIICNPAFISISPMKLRIMTNRILLFFINHFFQTRKVGSILAPAIT